MTTKVREPIVIGLKFYVEEMVQLDNDVDTLFDESYFLFLLNTRYKDVLKKFITKDWCRQIEIRKQKVFFLLESYFNEERKHLDGKSIFEKSQFWFNFMGFTYLKKLEQGDSLVKLTKSELKEIEIGYGYSATYDYMMTFFLQRLNQNIEKKRESVPTKNEEIYIATHKFLLETDYFSKKIMVENNTVELLNFLDNVLSERNEDLLAEILWGLNYFVKMDFPEKKEVEVILKRYLSNFETFNNANLSREKKHTLYACILCFMEEEMGVVKND